MKLQFPFIQLPLIFDASSLSEEISVLGEAPWKPHPQGFPGNSMLPLVAVGGDPDNGGFAGSMRPTPALLRCSYLMEVLFSLRATVGRTRLMRLAGQSEVTRHADQGYYWAERVRVHVPIITQPAVCFECGDSSIHMAAGECWIFDTWRQHCVFNDSVESRVHLVVDTVGGEGFWEMIARGRTHAARAAGWQPKFVVVGSVPTPSFPLESINVPRVMSPWEISTHLNLLFDDAVPHQNLGLMQRISAHFLRGWRGLWAQHGDAVMGLQQYRGALARYVAEMRGPSEGVMLKNDILWYNAMMVMIAKVAVTTETIVNDEHGIVDRA